MRAISISTPPPTKRSSKRPSTAWRRPRTSSSTPRSSRASRMRRAPPRIKVLRKSGKKMHASEAAVVVMKPDGAVVALVGGTDYAESTFNRATQAHRQPGSAFKPFVYLAALEAGLTPWDVRDDEAVDIDGWTPTNFGGRSYGTLTLADALAHSVNTITANLAQEVGISTIVDAAQRVAASPRRWSRTPRSRSAPPKSRRSNSPPPTPRSPTAAWRVTPYFVTEVDGTGGKVLYKRTRDRAAAHHRRACQQGSGGDDVRRGDIGHRPQRGARRPRGRGQDRHDAGLSRRLVRRLHRRLCRERVGRQRRLLADEDA